MFELVETANQTAVIKVIGVGGGGGNAVNHMLKAEIEGVEFICANTDAQALTASNARNLLQLGNTITHGLGAGADPEVGRQSALEDRDRIMDILDGADMIFITAGMGGGTGTGAAPIVAQVAKEMGILTVAVVTKPFSFEGKKRADIANNGIRELSQYVDSLITVPNDKLVDVLGSDVPLVNAFESADDVLLGAVQGIAQVITCQGLINVDFADVKTVMGEMGMAMMGSGKAQGEDRAKVATEAAISSPLLEHIDLSGAKGILANITAGMDFGIGEFNEVGNIIRTVAAEEATVVIGTVLNPELSGELWVTIVATGLSQPGEEVARPKLVAAGAGGAENMDYDILDRPTVMRNKAASTDMTPVRDDPEFLEIPAFLRRQAD